MMWLYYLLYAIFWLSIFGPMLFHEHHYKGAMKQAKHMNATNNNAVGDDGGGCRTI
jgi:type II secretory pathway component PulM